MTDKPLEWENITEQELAELRYRMGELTRKTRTEEYHLAACQGKSRFETRQLADSTIPFHKRSVVHAYHCPDCKGWHIGSRQNHDRKMKANRNILRKRREQCE